MDLKKICDLAEKIRDHESSALLYKQQLSDLVFGSLKTPEPHVTALDMDRILEPRSTRDIVQGEETLDNPGLIEREFRACTKGQILHVSQIAERIPGMHYHSALTACSRMARDGRLIRVRVGYYRLGSHAV